MPTVSNAPQEQALAGVAFFGNGRWSLDTWLLQRWPVLGHWLR